MALVSRLMMTCFIRVTSTSTEIPSVKRATILTPIFSAWSRQSLITTSTSSAASICCSFNLKLPRSMRVTSRRSLISNCKCFELSRMVSANSRRETAGNEPPLSRARSSENPTMALIGVRNSWLITARNCDFAVLAFSLASIANAM